MKLRIKGNSIRLRLLRSEVQKFAEAGRISDKVSFGTNGLRYTLEMSGDVDSILARYATGEISVLIPEQAARDWTTSEDVGFEIEHPLGDGELLSIIIEKDFACLDRPEDPDLADAFPNPNLVC
jgi:hypothetical protein